MSAADRLWEDPPFGLAPDEKEKCFTEALADLTASHRRRCPPYRNILGALGFDPASGARAGGVSIPAGGALQDPRALQRAARGGGAGRDLVGDLGAGPLENLSRRADRRRPAPRAGGDRFRLHRARPPADARDRLPVGAARRPVHGARGGGGGVRQLRRGRTWALGDDMRPDLDAVSAFLETYGGKPFLLFGFTFLVWQFFEALAASGRAWDFQNGVLIHGGGWKTLADRAVGPGGIPPPGWRRGSGCAGRTTTTAWRNRPGRSSWRASGDTCM